jgi:hypothetical protein
VTISQTSPEVLEPTERGFPATEAVTVNFFINFLTYRAGLYRCNALNLYSGGARLNPGRDSNYTDRSFFVCAWFSQPLQVIAG